MAVPTGTSQSAAAPASFRRTELREVEDLYRVIDDVLAGSKAVKGRNTLYLPMPSPADNSAENKARYVAYKTRAVFYAVTRRTLEGFLGELFDKDPTITIPTVMEAIIEDATGEGVGLIQLAKTLTRYTASKGRAGIFTDYPSTQGATTKADLEDNGVRPIIKAYHPLKIINWRYRKIGALSKLCLIVLEEEYDKTDRTFELTKGKQWRVLELDAANEYTQALYRDTSGVTPVNEKGEASAILKPLNGDGIPFKDIPFNFIGAEDNNADIDYPPMYDMADLNLAHYRNSADFEEAVYLCGQPTPAVSGLTQDWADRYFKNGVGLGSRAAIPLPVGASVELLQVTETTMAQAAMEQKERQMVALGAKLVEQKQVQRTATEAGLETASEKSALTTIADNVSVAIEWALGWAAMFMGVSEKDIVFQINKEFSLAFSTPEARKEAIEAWQSEAISFTEMRTALRKGGTATLPDEQAKKEIEDDRELIVMPELDPETGMPIPPQPGDPIPGQPKPPAPGKKSDDPIQADE